MKMKINCSWLVFAASVIACDSSKPPPSADTPTNVVTHVDSPEVISTSTQAASDCPHDGKWALCSIERRLRQSGFVARRLDGDTARRAGFAVRPVVYNLGRTRLEVFLYRDSASLARDIAKLDTLSVGPVGAPSQWGDVPPILLRSANMAAVIISQDPRQIERATLVLTAGPPQPGSPR